jgi:hypothetical protein
MNHPQFSIRSLLWLTLVVAAFLGGMIFERERARREMEGAHESPFYHAQPPME